MQKEMPCYYATRTGWEVVVGTRTFMRLQLMKGGISPCVILQEGPYTGQWFRSDEEVVEDTRSLPATKTIEAAYNYWRFSSV
jgi:hypothetical protein